MTLEKIAQDCLDIPTLEARNSDSLDFHEVSVWSLKKALRQAYQLGQQDLHGSKTAKTKEAR